MGYSLGWGYGYSRLGDIGTILNPITDVWVLTPTGISNIYENYIWFDVNPPGMWDDTWIWTD